MFTLLMVGSRWSIEIKKEERSMASALVAWTEPVTHQIRGAGVDFMPDYEYMYDANEFK